jgi:hypothetical protein
MLVLAVNIRKALQSMVLGVVKESKTIIAAVLKYLKVFTTFTLSVGIF